MKRIAIAASLIAAATSHSAFAQDAGQIQSVVEGAQSCIGCNLFQAELKGLDLSDRDFENARLRQANLSLSTLDRASMAGANLSVANMFGVRATSADFSNTDLSRAKIVGASLGSADLTGANLEGALLSGSYLTTAKGLTRAQLATAYCDESTLLPTGLTVDMCRKD